VFGVGKRLKSDMEAVDYKKEFETLEETFQSYVDTRLRMSEEAARELVELEFHYIGPDDKRTLERKALERYVSYSTEYQTYKTLLVMVKQTLGKPHYWLTEYCSCDECRAVRNPPCGGLYGPGRF
jgi:hypothetical protein